jgi:hypothetical protein
MVFEAHGLRFDIASEKAAFDLDAHTSLSYAPAPVNDLPTPLYEHGAATRGRGGMQRFMIPEL